jgi:hypothetical protein
LRISTPGIKARARARRCNAIILEYARVLFRRPLRSSEIQAPLLGPEISWEVGLALFVLGAAALWGARYFKIGGGLGFAVRGFGALAIPFSWAFQLNFGPIFPPSPVTGANRWKYLTLLAILWLIILPIAWWFAARALGK